MRIQRDRLVGEFTSALTAFQVICCLQISHTNQLKFFFCFQNIQKKTVDIEKGAYRAAQAGGNQYHLPKPPGSYNSSANNTSIFEDNFVNDGQDLQLQQQQQVEEYIDLEALEEQERTIRDLEVKKII